MNYVIKTLSIALFCFFSSLLFAVDNPQDVMGSQKFDAMRCISENTDTCISEICMNSEQVDCQDNCKKTAQQKCQQQINE